MYSRLIKLLDEADKKFGCFNAFCTEEATKEAKNKLRDYLLENGVTAPPYDDCFWKVVYKNETVC